MPYTLGIKSKNSIRWIIIVIPILTALLVGCIQRERSATAGGVPFELEIWVNDRCPSYDETVTIRATVTNRDSRTHIVELKDRPVLDIYAWYRATDEKLIRWSDDKPLTPDLTHLELKPGESKSIALPLVFPRFSCCAGASAQFYDESRLPNNPIGANVTITPADCVGH